jgi:hypothetical protein
MCTNQLRSLHAHAHAQETDLMADKITVYLQFSKAVHET